MTCPDCGCDEKIPGDGGYFCKDCGLELDEIVISSKGVGKAIVIQIPEINFTFNPKKELDALRIGLKRNKLIDGWQKILGFNLNGPLKPELKPRALELITKAYERNRDVLLKSRDQIETSWKKVNNKFFFEVENILDIKWPSYEYDAFLSLSIKYGIHNSPRNYIIIQQDSSNLSNYVIAHELYNIIHRSYVTRFFKEKFEDIDKDLIKIIATFILLDSDELKKIFPEMKFTLEMYHNQKYKDMASLIHPLWTNRESFKEFMINSYKALKHEKTWVSY